MGANGMCLSEIGSSELMDVLCVALCAKEVVAAGLNAIGASLMGAFRLVLLSSQPNHTLRFSYRDVRNSL